MTRIERSVVVARPVNEVYAYWRKFENLPTFMNNLRRVTTAGTTSHWVAEGILGRTIEWDADLIVDEPGRRLMWRTREDSDVQHEGSVMFRERPGTGVTEVSVSFTLQPPGGRLGEVVAALLGENPDDMVREDLQRFKHVMEHAGEIPPVSPTGTLQAPLPDVLPPTPARGPGTKH